jgi:hypothetical protein
MTIKLASLAADLDRELKGDWVEYPEWPGVSFNVSSLMKPAYVTERDILLQRLARLHKGKPPPAAEIAPEAGRLYCRHILHGWSGLDVEYSAETALEVMSDPAYRAVVLAVEWCAGQIAQLDVEFVEAEAKNSVAPSETA